MLLLLKEKYFFLEMNGKIFLWRHSFCTYFIIKQNHEIITITQLFRSY